MRGMRRRTAWTSSSAAKSGVVKSPIPGISPTIGSSPNVSCVPGTLNALSSSTLHLRSAATGAVVGRHVPAYRARALLPSRGPVVGLAHLDASVYERDDIRRQVFAKRRGERGLRDILAALGLGDDRLLVLPRHRPVMFIQPRCIDPDRLPESSGLRQVCHGQLQLADELSALLGVLHEMARTWGR